MIDMTRFSIKMSAFHVFTLFMLAVAQPLFYLLSKNAEFFVARGSERLDIILFVLILCMLLPLSIVLFEFVMGRFNLRLLKWFHALIVTVLVAAILLPALKKIHDLPGSAILTLGILSGVIFTILYMRYRIVKMFLSFLFPVIIICPIIFFSGI